MNVDHATGLCGGIVVPSGAKRPRCGQPREVRQPARGHQVARQLVVEPVEAEDDHARGRRALDAARDASADERTPATTPATPARAGTLMPVPPRPARRPSM